MRALIALSLLLLTDASDPPATRIDPLTVQDDDFARHRDPAAWGGLTVEQLDFGEERATWRLWRISDPKRPRGPLWFVPHDNEDAGFEAALVAIRRHGGTIVAVDAGIDPVNDGQRMNRAVAFGSPIDPNRNFHDGLPLYRRAVMAALAAGARQVIALHSNNAGYDPAESKCPPLGDTGGRGVVSIRYCDDVLAPSPSQTRAYPFDDDDTVAFATFASSKGRDSAWCGRELIAADFNVLFERVANTDGSLSNYAVLTGVPYLNFETREPGPGGPDLAAARDRLTSMVDRAMAVCPAP